MSEFDGEGVAERVVVSYPADLSDWGRMQVDTDRFRAYLRRVHDRASEGEAWAEFVGVGCCGDSLDVPMRVERVEGGPRIVGDTAVEFTERAACGLAGGWRVQSEAGPTGSDPATETGPAGETGG
jgi:hypothetical protein